MKGICRGVQDTDGIRDWNKEKDRKRKWWHRNASKMKDKNVALNKNFTGEEKSGWLERD